MAQKSVTYTTPITAGTYGSTTQSAVVTLSAQGAVTAAVSSTIVGTDISLDNSAAVRYPTNTAVGGIFYGTGTKAQAANSSTNIFIGNGSGTNVGTGNATVVGNAALAQNSGSTAIGASANAGSSGVAVGLTANAASGGIAIGSGAVCNAGLVVGNSSSGSDGSSLVFGAQSGAGSGESIVVGRLANNFGQGITIGNNAGTSGARVRTVTIGHSTGTSGDDTTIVGHGSVASAVGATGIGRNVSVSASSGTALGFAAGCNVASGVSLGVSASVTDTAHAIGFGTNSASIAPGYLGITTNGVSKALDCYSSLYASTATAAGTTALTVLSAKRQYFTGTTTQTVTLPAVATLANGFEFKIVNNSTGAVAVQTSTAVAVTSLAGAVAAVNRGGWGLFTCINSGGTNVAADWSYEPGATTL